MGRSISFCVGVSKVFGHDSKEYNAESSSSSQKRKSKKKWRFGRSKHDPTPSPPVERNAPSPVPLQPSGPHETISPSPIPPPPIEKTSPVPSPSEEKTSPVPSPQVERTSPSPSLVETKSLSPVPSPIPSLVETKSLSPVPSPIPSPVPSPPPIRVTPIHITPFSISPIPITPIRITPVHEIITEPIQQNNENLYVTIQPMVSDETEVAQVTEESEEIFEEVDEVEVVSATDVASPSSKSKEDIAAIMIQSLYRGYLARRAVRALSALERLKTLVEGDAVKHQTATALKAMQALTRIQSQVRSRRIRMHEDNQALHTQLQLKHQRDLERLKLTEDWNSSAQSKEQIEASLLKRHEASMRRERALAYAFSHQWKASSRSVSTTFLPDPTNPQWGWSWLDRWMGVSRLSRTSITDRESTNSLNPFTISKNTRKSVEDKLNNPIMSPDRPSSPALSLSRMSVVSMPSPKRSSVRNSHFGATSPMLPGGPSSRSYMQPTESVKAKSRLVRASTDQSEKGEITEEKKEKGLARKRLSFSVVDGKSGMNQGRVRRHVGTGKSSDVASVKSVSSFKSISSFA